MQNEQPSVIAKPIVKWAGGKRWLSRKINELKPPNWCGRYFEPFCGGGAFFFALRPKKATLSDANRELIATYRAIKSNPEGVIRLLNSYPYEKSFYYKLRRRAPKTECAKAARFVYLNRCCWNGLYRVTKEGKFNTPFGRYKNPLICDKVNIRAVARALKLARLFSGDFETFAKEAKRGDLVYFDPPYITGHLNNGFLMYNKKLFSWADQERLARLATKLTKKGVFVLVSNADHAAVKKLYKGFHKYKVMRASLIGGQNKSRGVVTEVLISNYSLRRIKKEKFYVTSGLSLAANKP